MCLIAFAIGLRPDLPLWLASNRDEAFDRPTAPLHRWRSDGGVDIVGGRDLLDGGTWLGISTAGRVAWLTNVRQADSARGQRSRGELVTRWLAGRHDAAGFAEQVEAGHYGGFNLVVGDLRHRTWAWIGNRDPHRPHQPQTPRLHTRPIGAGVHTVSNASLNTPWPKTQRLKAAIGEALANPTDWLMPLSNALTHDQPVPEHDLPLTGLPVDLERTLSSPFVRMADRTYGTRTSQVVSVRAAAQGYAVTMHEWTHDPASRVSGLAHECARVETLVW